MKPETRHFALQKRAIGYSRATLLWPKVKTMNGTLVQVIMIALLIGLPLLLIASSRRKSDTQKRIADALEEIAKKNRSD